MRITAAYVRPGCLMPHKGNSKLYTALNSLVLWLVGATGIAKDAAPSFAVPRAPTSHSSGSEVQPRQRGPNTPSIGQSAEKGQSTQPDMNNRFWRPAISMLRSNNAAAHPMSLVAQPRSVPIRSVPTRATAMRLTGRDVSCVWCMAGVGIEGLCFDYAVHCSAHTLCLPVCHHMQAQTVITSGVQDDNDQYYAGSC